MVGSIGRLIDCCKFFCFFTGVFHQFWLGARGFAGGHRLVDHVFNFGQQIVTAFLDMFRIFQILLWNFSKHLILNDLCESNDRIQGRTQIMIDGGKKLITRALFKLR